MSNALKVWQQPDEGPEPTTLEQALDAMQALETTQPGVNPLFVALAHKVVKQFPVDVEDSVWMSSPIEDSMKARSAVWTLDLPEGDERLYLTRCVVDEAAALGLTVLDPQLAMAFMPSGKVLPESDQAAWDDLKQQMDTQPRGITKAEVRKMMCIFLNEALKGHGFVGKKLPDCDMAYVRGFEEGEQIVTMKIRGNNPDLRCEVECVTRNNQVRHVLTQVFDNPYITQDALSFTVGDFVGKLGDSTAVTNSKEVKLLLSLLESKAIPLMETARSLDGLDRIYHQRDMVPLEYEARHPRDPKTLSAYLYSNRSALRGLAVAWLNRNPDFEQFAQEVSDHVKVFRVMADDFHKLIAHLRAHVPGGPRA